VATQQQLSPSHLTPTTLMSAWRLDRNRVLNARLSQALGTSIAAHDPTLADELFLLAYELARDAGYAAERLTVPPLLADVPSLRNAFLGGCAISGAPADDEASPDFSREGCWPNRVWTGDWHASLDGEFEMRAAVFQNAQGFYPGLCDASEGQEGSERLRAPRATLDAARAEAERWLSESMFPNGEPVSGLEAGSGHEADNAQRQGGVDLTAALGHLRSLVENGVEYPDAHTSTIWRYRLTVDQGDELQALYDTVSAARSIACPGVEASGPLAKCGGEELLLTWLACTFPGVRFTVGEDATAIFVKFVVNAAGAPSPVDVHAQLLAHFGARHFKMPFFIDSARPRPDGVTLVAWRESMHAQSRAAGVAIDD